VAREVTLDRRLIEMDEVHFRQHEPVGTLQISMPACPDGLLLKVKVTRSPGTDR
jgi:hypothetical protein